MDKLEQVINDVISLENATYNIDNVDDETLDKASRMLATIRTALYNERKERNLRKTLLDKDIEGKYIKVHQEAEGSCIYMLVRSVFITTHYSSNEVCLCIQGTAFSFCLKSDFSDNNVQGFSTWRDVYVTEADLDRNENTIEIITQDTFKEAFNEMISELQSTFDEWYDETLPEKESDNTLTI